MSTMVAPPEDATLEELESFTSRINRAFQELPRLTYATIGGKEVELTNMDSAIQSLVTTSHHDQLTGVAASLKHLLFLDLAGTRSMTGNLNLQEPTRGSLAYQIGAVDVLKFGSGVGSLFIGEGAGGGTGTYNIAIGTDALDAGTTGASNIAIGRDAIGTGTGSLARRNVAVGYQSLAAASKPSYNVAIGFQAMQLGSQAGEFGSNVAIGRQALQYTYGYANVAIGAFSLLQCGQGQDNTAIGYNSLSNLTTADGNTAVGHDSGDGVTGSDNVLLGNSAALGQGAISNELWIANTSTATPLIWGDFATADLIFNADVLIAATKALSVDTISEVSGNAGVTIDSMLVKDGHILLTALGGYVAQGDLIAGGAADYAILSIDTAGKILMSDGTDPGWTTTFTADMLFASSAKCYFDAGAAVGGEYWTSALDTYLDGHFEHGMRLYEASNLLLTIRRYDAGNPTLPVLEFGDTFYINVGATNTALVRSNYWTFYKFINVRGNSYISIVDGSDGSYNNCIIWGTGADAKIYYNTHLILDPNKVGTGWVYIGAAAEDSLACGRLKFNSGLEVEQATISAAATLTAAHYIVLCDTDTAGAAFTVTLPAAASHPGRVYEIINTGTSGFDVTVDGNGAEEIQHAATQIVGDGQAMAIICDGAAWWVI